jgi:hypothetical protein
MTEPSNGNGNSRGMLIAQVIGIMILLGTPFTTLMVMISNTAADVVSLRQRIVALERQQSDVHIAALRRDLVEVETQFCAEDAMRNLMHANDLRNMSVLWQKTMGTDYPVGNAYYPAIGRCHGGG